MWPPLGPTCRPPESPLRPNQSGNQSFCNRYCTQMQAASLLWRDLNPQKASWSPHDALRAVSFSQHTAAPSGPRTAARGTSYLAWAGFPQKYRKSLPASFALTPSSLKHLRRFAFGAGKENKGFRHSELLLRRTEVMAHNIGSKHFKCQRALDADCSGITSVRQT